MVSVKPLPSRASVTEVSLIGLLRQVGASLGNLRLRTEAATARKEPEALGFCPRQMEALGEILESGRHRIARRIAELGGAAQSLGAPSLPERTADPVAFMIEYRDCCRRLCAALNESLRSSDAATGALLSDLALRLEKQLWLMDTSPHDRGAESCRSVSLFLTC
jgi:hypothetical protein